MKFVLVIISTAALFFVLTSCKEEFDFNQVTEGLERLVVEGYITDVDSIHVVKLMVSSDFIDPQPAIPAKGAQVTVSSGKNLYSFTESEPGIYKNEQYFKGEIGSTYNLKIVYNNETFSAQSHLNSTFDLDSAIVVWEDEINHVYISGQEPPAPNNYYIIKYSVDGVLIDSLNNWGFFKDELINGIYLDSELVLMVDGEENDDISIKLISVSENFFEYVTSIAYNTGFEPDPFFSTTPANFKGNISNGALGFFQASAIRTKNCERLSNYE
jgi:hypothetical protein